MSSLKKILISSLIKSLTKALILGVNLIKARQSWILFWFHRERLMNSEPWINAFYYCWYWNREIDRSLVNNPTLTIFNFTTTAAKKLVKWTEKDLQWSAFFVKVRSRDATLLKKFPSLIHSCEFCETFSIGNILPGNCCPVVRVLKLPLISISFFMSY